MLDRKIDAKRSRLRLQRTVCGAARECIEEITDRILLAQVLNDFELGERESGQSRSCLDDVSVGVAEIARAGTQFDQASELATRKHRHMDVCAIGPPSAPELRAELGEANRWTRETIVVDRRNQRELVASLSGVENVQMGRRRTAPTLRRRLQPPRRDPRASPRLRSARPAD